jgi:hypothetical protein
VAGQNQCGLARSGREVDWRPLLVARTAPAHVLADQAGIFELIARAKTSIARNRGHALRKCVKAAVGSEAVIGAPRRRVCSVNRKRQAAERDKQSRQPANDRLRRRARAQQSAPGLGSMESNAQCEQFHRADPEHQHRQGYGIVLEPMPPLCVHDTPPLFSRSLVAPAGKTVQSREPYAFPQRRRTALVPPRGR